MDRGDSIARVVDCCYAAALDPSGWHLALEGLTELFDGVSATLELHHKKTKDVLFFEGLNVDAGQQASYIAHYVNVCPRISVAVAAAEGAALYDGLFFSERDIDRSEFYQDFLAPHDMRYLAGLSLINTSDRVGVMGVHRSARVGHVSNEETRWLGLLMPHLRRALELSARLSDAAIRQRELRAALSRLASAVILLDARGSVAFMNDAARERLPQTPLIVRNQRIDARSASGRRQLRQALIAALEPRIGERDVPRPVILEDEEGAAHVFHICPLPSLPRRRQIFAADDPPNLRAMVVFDAAEPLGETALLRRAHGLTPAEGEVALALCEGRSSREIAAARGVSFNTVRSLVARAREKLGARSHADLVRRVMALCRSRVR
jgi:DNA-binding CsgD family transcriptional regulator/PAS domain-containing protein